MRSDCASASWRWGASPPSVTSYHGLDVQNVVGANDLRIGVGEQRKIDFAAIGEIFQYGFAVIADRCEPDSLLLELCFGVLQLNQLPFAVGSPISGITDRDYSPHHIWPAFGQRSCVSRNHERHRDQWR